MYIIELLISLTQVGLLMWEKAENEPETFQTTVGLFKLKLFRKIRKQVFGTLINKTTWLVLNIHYQGHGTEGVKAHYTCDYNPLYRSLRKFYRLLKNPAEKNTTSHIQTALYKQLIASFNLKPK